MRRFLPYLQVGEETPLTFLVRNQFLADDQFSCGKEVKKSLSQRTHACACGCVLDRDYNAAVNILYRALDTTGHVGTWINDPHASGDLASTVLGASLSQQAGSMNEESPSL